MVTNPLSEHDVALVNGSARVCRALDHTGAFPWNCLSAFLLVLLASLHCFSHPGRAQDRNRDPKVLSLDSLLNVKISTASKYWQTSSEAPASVSIITATDIERYGYQNFEEVLKSIRGFYVSNDRNYTYLGVRGFSRPTDYNNRILLLIDGHAMNENVYGSAPLGTDFSMDLSTIERIEVVRGPGSVLYGTGAMFAVINIVTKKGSSVDGIHVSAKRGSFGRLEGSAIVGKQLGNGVALFMSGIWSDSKGQDLFFEEYNSQSSHFGIARNLDWDNSYGLFSKVRYNGLSLHGIVTSRRKGIPTGAFGITFNDPSARTLDQRVFLELKYEAEAGPSTSITARAYLDRYHYDGVYPYEVLSFDASDGHWLGGEVQLVSNLGPSNRLRSGIQYKKHSRADYRYWNEEQTYFNGDFPYSVASVYLEDEYQILQDLSVTLGVSHDEYSAVGSSTTPRGAVIINPMRSSTLKLLYGEGFRAPNVFEVNYLDPFGGFKPNRNLRPEKIRTLEAVWEQRFSSELFGIISIYNIEMSNLIDTRLDEADSLLQFQNVGEVMANGLELEVNARLKVGLQGYLNYAFHSAKDVQLRKKLTNSPSHLFKAGFIYPVLRTVHAAAELSYESGRITVRGTRTDPSVVASINISAEPEISGDSALGQFLNRARLSFGIKNIFDVHYQTPGGFEHLQPAIEQNGRAFCWNFTYEL